MSWDKDVPAPGIQARYLDDAVRTNNAAIDAVIGTHLAARAAITATAAEINTTCDGSTAKNSHTHTLATGASDVTASAAELNQCDGKTLVNTVDNQSIGGTKTFTTGFTVADGFVDMGLSVVVQRGGIAQPRQKVINIGVWNMDSTSAVSVAHGVTLTKIVSVSGILFNDALSTGDPIPYTGDTDAGDHDLYISSVTTTNVILNRVTGGDFDSTNYNDAVMNRGYILVTYID